MKTEVANPRRRIRFRVIAGLVIAGALVGALMLAAMAAAGGTTSAAATSSATSSAAPSASASTGSAATPTPDLVTVAPSTTPTSRPAPQVSEFLVGQGTEPSVAADPFHPGVVAVISENIFHTENGICSKPDVRVSTDAGATFGPAVRPWANGCQDSHAVIAWGPDSRLWAGNAVGVTGGVAMSVTHSDDLGRSWAKTFVERFTPPWSGCFPSIAVDNWPGSPNFGTVYVAYNWLPDGYGPHVAVMASKDGTAWVHTEVPLDAAPSGYPFSWRIGYRIAAAPNGSAFVSFYQSSLKYWNPNNMLYEGSGSEIDRLGFEIAVVHFDGKKLSADHPVWAIDVDHTEAQWQSALAVDDSGRAWLAVESAGRISLGRLDSGWREISVPDKYSFKPSLAVSGKTIFVGWHAQDKTGNVSTYYTFSFDGGETFLPPALVSNATWNTAAETMTNGVGLRENADFGNGVVYYAYGDARSGTAVYMAQIRP